MMRHLAALFVGKPLNILVVAALFSVAHLVLRHWSKAGGGSPRALLLASGAWALYAAWEWLVRVRTPDANIRVDLLVIWPVLAIASVWALVRAVRSL
jgi:hypothetical protein